jgi:hypothetical protein
VDDASPFEIREYRPGDELAILATFNRVFADEDPRFVARDLATWRWQFLANPSGSRIYLALDADGAVVSQYAGIGQRVQLDGARARFSQSVDSMTDPSRRSGLKKPGAFVLTGRPYAAAFGGPPPDRDSVMWGLPVPAAWRIGHEYLGYELVRTVDRLVADPAVVSASSKARLAVHELERAPSEVDNLFERVACEHGAIAVRDQAQLEWRYFAHPSRRYRVAGVCGAGELRGLAAYRAGSFDGESGGLVCDWLVPAEDREAGETLRAWVADCARAEGERRLVALFPDTAPQWLEFQRAGFRVAPTRYVLAARSYQRRVTRDWLRKHWYYTLGDTDLV